MSQKVAVILVQNTDGEIQIVKSGTEVSKLLKEAKTLAQNPPKDAKKVMVLTERRSTEFVRRVNKEQAVTRDGDDLIIVESSEAVRIEGAAKEKKSK